MSNIFTEVKRNTKANAMYIEMAIETLVESCDWVNANDNNILIFKLGHDFVAIPDVYCDEGTEFWSTLDVKVTLIDNGKTYVAVTVD